MINITGFKKIILRCLLLLSASSSISNANPACFASAETYYEHIYCELEVKGQVRGLPAFDQFKKNSDIVQASLLKSLAEKNHITFIMPSKKAVVNHGNMPAPVDIAQQSLTSVTRDVEIIPTQIASHSQHSNCSIDTKGIHCGPENYCPVGNKANSHLAAGALDAENKMALPAYDEVQPRENYVTVAYRRYIEKMCAIGLCGVTMTYAKFIYFYRDLQDKNVNFSARFETMYTFLKKDKATLWVSEKVTVNKELQIDDCEQLSKQYYVCARRGENYIFELQ